MDFRLELEVTKEAHLLFKIIDQRYKQNKLLLFTTNVQESEWTKFLGDRITTSAILDRLFHRSIKVERGTSYREYLGKLLQKNIIIKSIKASSFSLARIT